MIERIEAKLKGKRANTKYPVFFFGLLHIDQINNLINERITIKACNECTDFLISNQRRKKKRERFSCTYTVLWLIEVKIIQGVVGVHEWIYSTYCVISSLIIHTFSYFTLCGRFHFIHQAFITLRRIIYFELLVWVYWKYLHILNLLIYISKLIKSSLKQNSIISSFIVY